MSFNLIDPVTKPQNVHHIAIARRVLARRRNGHALPAPEPASGGHSGDAALPDAPPVLRVVRHARELVRGDGVSLAGSSSLADRTYLITEADLDNLDRALRDLSDLLAPLNGKDPERYRAGCMLVARLDRVIRRALDRGQSGGDAA